MAYGGRAVRMSDEGLVIRKVPDKTDTDRVVRYDSETGERKLVNPDTPGEEHEAWPLLGVQIENEEPPQTVVLSMSFVAAARAEGWIEVAGEWQVFKPGGPPENPWAVTHTFTQLDEITIKTLDGDVKYKVTHNPDKYDGSGNPTDAVGDPDASVDWHYGLELVE